MIEYLNFPFFFIYNPVMFYWIVSVSFVRIVWYGPALFLPYDRLKSHHLLRFIHADIWKIHRPDFFAEILTFFYFFSHYFWTARGKILTNTLHRIWSSISCLCFCCKKIDRRLKCKPQKWQEKRSRKKSFSIKKESILR